MFKPLVFFALGMIALGLHPASASAATECNLTVLTTSVQVGGLKWNFLRYPDVTLNDCMSTCKSREILSAEVDPEDTLVSCRMTFVAADGIITKAKYKLLQWPR